MELESKNSIAHRLPVRIANETQNPKQWSLKATACSGIHMAETPNTVATPGTKEGAAR
jgi:hypothetical protein